MKYTKWQFPDIQSLKDEYHREYQIKPLKSSNIFPTVQDFLTAVNKGEIVTITPQIDRNISYRSSTKSFDDLHNLIKGYGSYPQYRNEKTLKNLYDRINNNQPLDMPLVLKYPDGRMRVFAGNTRMDVAFQLGVNPKVVMIPVPLANEQAITERKQVGSVYHFTKVTSLFNILKYNQLNAHQLPGTTAIRGRDMDTISTTRSKSFHQREKGRMVTGMAIRIELDGDKLSDKYKVVPFDAAFQSNNSIEVIKRRKDWFGDEMEQLWYGQKIESDGGIKQITSYIKNIEFLEPDSKEWTDVVQTFNHRISKAFQPNDWLEIKLFSYRLTNGNDQGAFAQYINFLALTRMYPNINITIDPKLYNKVPFREKVDNILSGKSKQDEQQLSERKQVGTVYHFTSVKSINNILSKDKLWPSTDEFTTPIRGQRMPTISTTRSKDFHKRSGGRMIGGTTVRIELDGDKLSDKYKVAPFDATYLPGQTDYVTKSNRKQFGDEMEELWYGPRVDKDYGITPLSKYVKSVQFLIPSNPKMVEKNQIYRTYSENLDQKVQGSTAEKIRQLEHRPFGDGSIYAFCQYVNYLVTAKQFPNLNITFDPKLLDKVPYKDELEEVMLRNKPIDEQQLSERKQVGTVYHFTSATAITSILARDKLRASDNEFTSPQRGEPIPTVSTTRSKDFDKRKKGRMIGGISVRIELDGDKLSDKYKVVPFNAAYSDDPEHIPFNVQRQEDYGDEMEELWYGKRLSNDYGIKPISQFIKSIQYSVPTGRYGLDEIKLAYEGNKSSFNQDISSAITQLRDKITTNNSAYTYKELLLFQQYVNFLTLTKRYSNLNIVFDPKLLDKVPYKDELEELMLRNKPIDEQQLSERKQVGDVYHFTHRTSLFSILDSDILRAGKTVKDLDWFISTTRSKNFADRKGGRIIGGIDIRLTLDGDKLSDKYKVTPYDATVSYGKVIPTLRQDYGDETEERWTGAIMNRDKGIRNISKYIKAINVTKTGLNQLINQRIYSERFANEIADILNIERLGFETTPEQRTDFVLKNLPAAIHKKLPNVKVTYDEKDPQDSGLIKQEQVSITEQDNKRIIAIYPGRFQPFGPHHAKAYQWLASKFGPKNTYVVTSNKVDEKSPFTFDQKKQIMIQSGVPANKIVQVVSPYKPVELLVTFGSDTAVVFMYGEKDAGRLSYTKKDGSPGYFEKYEGQSDLQGFNDKGYVVIAPHINVHGDVSGTKLREMIPQMTPQQFKQVMGWFDQDTFDMMKSVLGNKNEQSLTHRLRNTAEGLDDVSPQVRRQLGTLETFLKKGYDKKAQRNGIVYLYIDTNKTQSDGWDIYGDIHAFDQKTGERVGHVTVGRQKPTDPFHGSMDVLSSYRRRGIATFMYDWAEDIYGIPLVPEPKHSSDSEKFWKSRKTRQTQQRLSERKQVGDVYHFTGLRAFSDILATNRLKAGTTNSEALETFSDLEYSISTTRYKNFHKRKAGRGLMTPPQIALQLDGNKMSDNYQVMPYDDVHRMGTRDAKDVPSYRRRYGDEAEEMWYGKRIEKDKAIEPILPYIKKVIVVKGGLYLTFPLVRKLTNTFEQVFKQPITINGQVIKSGYELRDFWAATNAPQSAIEYIAAQIITEMCKQHNIPLEFEEGEYNKLVGNRQSISEITSTGAFGQEVDDGPRFFYGNIKSYQARSSKVADMIGWDVADWLINIAQELEVHDTDPPNGPPTAVSYFPVGDKNKPNAGTNYSTNVSSKVAYEMWVKDLKRRIKSTGMSFSDTLETELSKNNISLVEVKTLTEGGAAGHMNHPFDLPQVKSGDDLLKVFEQTAKYLKDNSGSVKIDGVNASIRLVTIDGRKQFVMDRGSKKELDVKGITKQDLLNRFGAGHGMIEVGGQVLDIFNEAINSITAELKTLGLWDDPNILFNMEYVKGQTNVQQYGKNFLAIHGLLKIHTGQKQGARALLTTRSTKEISYSKTALDKLLTKLTPFAKKHGFEVYGSIGTTLRKNPQYSSALSKRYTINTNRGEMELSLKQLLNAVNQIPKDKFIKFEGKKVGAVSKAVYLAVLDGVNIDQAFDDSKAALAGFTTYLATEKLGDELLKVLDSALGSVDQQEGVVIRGLYDDIFKVTGSFITRGVTSSFQK